MVRRLPFHTGQMTGAKPSIDVINHAETPSGETGGNQTGGTVTMTASAWDERYRRQPDLGHPATNELVVSLLSGLAPGSALDLGAGSGRNAVWLAERDWHVRTVDFSEVALAFAQELASSRGVAIETEQADVTSYEPDPLEWDLVLISYLQLPTDQRRDVLARASRWVRPGGLLLVIAHDLANIDRGYGGPRSAEVSYTPDDTIDALDGLVITRAETVERQVETDAGPRTALDTLVLATRDRAA